MNDSNWQADVISIRDRDRPQIPEGPIAGDRTRTDLALIGMTVRLACRLRAIPLELALQKPSQATLLA